MKTTLPPVARSDVVADSMRLKLRAASLPELEAACQAELGLDFAVSIAIWSVELEAWTQVLNLQ
jgi:hypothetical protein